jgi:hypothetical protein
MSVQGQIPKEPAETFPIGYKFKRLAAGETIVTPTVTSKIIGGADSTSTFLSGSPTVDGADPTIVKIRVQAGLSGEKHRVQFRVVTSVPNTYEGEIDVQVKEY